MRRFVNHRPRATIGRHSLSHALRACQLPQRGSQETVRSPPAPSLRELSSECETEGVYFDERERSKISEFM